MPSELYELVEDSVTNLRAKYAEASEDGNIDGGEIAGLAFETFGALTAAILHVSGHGTVDMRRECILEAADAVVDDLIAYNFPNIPDLWEGFADRLLDSTGRAYVAERVGKLLDTIPGMH